MRLSDPPGYAYLISAGNRSANHAPIEAIQTQVHGGLHYTIIFFRRQSFSNDLCPNIHCIPACAMEMLSASLYYDRFIIPFMKKIFMNKHYFTSEKNYF
jgi:hypothetical protein